ncbi:hypothetical protein HDU67_003401 [Dinochytrium kinnereticum]|nr:hypothetical protein HDU67_003401 [Dinochytrium kinnereticum]
MDPYSPQNHNAEASAPLNNDPLEDLESEEQRRLAAEQAITGHIDLYALLNLNKDATSEDIKNAYRRMCVTFHPDKHQRPEDKEAAERQFQMIQRAYDVLSNPGRRHIYDSYGMEGLSTNWEIGPRLRTTEEVRPGDNGSAKTDFSPVRMQIREEYERQSRQRLQNEVDNLIRSRGEILVGVNASHLFEPLISSSNKRAPQIPQIGIGRRRERKSGLRLPEITQAFVKHSWETKIAPQTDFFIQGSVLARNGVGAGTVIGTLRHVISPLLWAELSGSVGQSQMASLKLVKNFSSDVFSTISVVSTTPSVPPPVSLSVGRKLTDHITGYITFRTGQYSIGSWGADVEKQDASSCAVGFVRKHEASQWTLDVTAGEAASFASLSYYQVVAKGTRGRVSFVAGTSTGIQGAISIDKKVNKHDRLGLGVECGTLTGIVFRLRFIRLGQKLSVPIIISPQFDMQLAFWITAIPLIASYSFDKLVFEPWRQKRFTEKLQMIRLENAEVLAERKRNAEDAIKLMKDQVARKVDAEEMKNGLIIIEALYGKLPPSRGTDRMINKEYSFNTIRGLFSAPSGASTPPNMDSRVDLLEGQTTQDVTTDDTSREFIDVTIPIQNLVINSQLHISGGYSKSNLMGFYDPCLGESKSLRITYSFRGNLHFLEVRDTSAVAAPLRGIFSLRVSSPKLM